MFRASSHFPLGARWAVSLLCVRLSGIWMLSQGKGNSCCYFYTWVCDRQRLEGVILERWEVVTYTPVSQRGLCRAHSQKWRSWCWPPPSFKDDGLDDDDVFRMLFCIGGVMLFVQCVWHSDSGLVLICLALVKQSHCWNFENCTFFFSKGKVIPPHNFQLTTLFPVNASDMLSVTHN